MNVSLAMQAPLTQKVDNRAAIIIEIGTRLTKFAYKFPSLNKTHFIFVGLASLASSFHSIFSAPNGLIPWMDQMHLNPNKSLIRIETSKNNMKYSSNSSRTLYSGWLKAIENFHIF
jgi:hypothetical protein